MIYHSAGHNSNELAEAESLFDLLAQFGINITHILLFDLHAEGLHDGFQLASINLPGVFAVENFEGLL